MKKTTTIILFFISLTVFAQEQINKRPTLLVVGTAKVTVKPDLGVLNIYVSEIRPKMNDAIKSLGDKSNYYNDLLKKLGFNEKDIKTTSFNVAVNRLYKQEKYIDSGYIASQNIRFEFNYNQQILQKIIGEISRSDKSINFSFDFDLSEQLKQKVQNQIIENAVKDANEKAVNIAKASGLKLLKIIRIDYDGWGRDGGMQIVGRNQTFSASSESSETFQSFNFTPNDLIFNDAMRIEWELGQ